MDWTGGLDWWTGLVDWTGRLDWWTDIFCAKITLMRPHSPVGLDMMHFSLYKPGTLFSLFKLEVNNCS